jgi:hypothetical protein
MNTHEYECFHDCVMCGRRFEHYVVSPMDAVRAHRDDGQPDICSRCLADNTCPHCGDFPMRTREVEFVDENVPVCLKCGKEVG